MLVLSALISRNFSSSLLMYNLLTCMQVKVNRTLTFFRFLSKRKTMAETQKSATDESHSESESECSDNEGLEELNYLTETLMDVDHLEELKWLHKNLHEECNKRKKIPKREFKDVELVPNGDKVQAALETDVVQRLLKYFELEGSKDGQPNWTIPKHFTVELLAIDSKIVLDMIIDQIEKCKSCKYRFKSIMKHLKKDKECMDTYSEEEVNELLKISKLKAKVKAKEWQKKNKKSVAEKKAKRYQSIKKERAASYQKNKEIISRRKKEYENENRDEISQRKAKYYQKNKEKYSKNYAIKVEEKKVSLKKSYAVRDERLLRYNKDVFCKSVKKHINYKWILYKVFFENTQNFLKFCFSEEGRDYQHIIPLILQLEQEVGNTFTIQEAKVDHIYVKEVLNCKDGGELSRIKGALTRQIDEDFNEFQDGVDTKLRKIANDLQQKFKCGSCIRMMTYTGKSCKKCSI